jgi:acyl carrier protein
MLEFIINIGQQKFSRCIQFSFDETERNSVAKDFLEKIAQRVSPNKYEYVLDNVNIPNVNDLYRNQTTQAEKIPFAQSNELLVSPNFSPITQNMLLSIENQKRSECTMPKHFSSGYTFLAPKTSTEIRLANVWKDVFKKYVISTTDNIFDLSSDSMLVIRLLISIKNEFMKELSITDIYENPSLYQMAKQINASEAIYMENTA